MLVLIVFGLLMAQGILFLNPDSIDGMSWDLALHTAVSFLTNTNQQHYSGQAQLSYLAHTFGIVTLQVVTPAAGMAALVAIVRTLLGRNDEKKQPTGEDVVSVGIFYEDITRAIVRVMLPIAAVVALIIASQGVPNSYEARARPFPWTRPPGWRSRTSRSAPWHPWLPSSRWAPTAVVGMAPIPVFPWKIRPL